MIYNISTICKTFIFYNIQHKYKTYLYINQFYFIIYNTYKYNTCVCDEGGPHKMELSPGG